MFKQITNYPNQT